MQYDMLKSSVYNTELSWIIQKVINMLKVYTEIGSTF